jgi:hypothetical protein
MQTIKTIFQFIEGVVATFWGLTIIDYFAVPKPINYNLQDIISSGVQSLYIVVGLIYFILNGIYRHQTKQLEREEKRLKNLKLQEEVESMEIDNEKKNVNNSFTVLTQ